MAAQETKVSFPLCGHQPSTDPNKQKSEKSICNSFNHQEIIPLTSELLEIINASEKWAKVMKIDFTEKKIQVALQPMRRRPPSFGREMQSEATEPGRLHLSDWHRTKTLNTHEHRGAVATGSQALLGCHSTVPLGGDLPKPHVSLLFDPANYFQTIPGRYRARVCDAARKVTHPLLFTANNPSCFTSPTQRDTTHPRKKDTEAPRTVVETQPNYCEMNTGKCRGAGTVLFMWKQRDNKNTHICLYFGIKLWKDAQKPMKVVRRGGQEGREIAGLLRLFTTRLLFLHKPLC